MPIKYFFRLRSDGPNLGTLLLAVQIGLARKFIDGFLRRGQLRRGECSFGELVVQARRCSIPFDLTLGLLCPGNNLGVVAAEDYAADSATARRPSHDDG